MSKSRNRGIRLPKTKGGRMFAVIIVLIVAAAIAYFVHGAVAGEDTAGITYTTGTVEKMTLTSSVSGEGNVEWLRASDVTSSLSGEVSHISVSLGELVKEDQKLFVVAGSRSSRWITAPHAGTITALNVTDGEDVTSPAATIIDLTAFRAVIAVAESDISAVEVGQKAVITFDALTDLTLTGKVTSVSYAGNNTSGVVSYEVVVLADSTQEDVRGGMTVSVNIITDVKADILVVPLSAVKTASDGTSYVQILDEESQLTDVTVETGMTTDTYIEIVSGLKEGQEIVVSQTKAGSTTATTSSQRDRSGLLNSGGGMQSGEFPAGGGSFNAPPQ